MKNVRRHRVLSLSQQKEEEIILVLEANFHTTKFSTEYLLAKEMKRMQIRMTKPVYLRL